MKRLMSLMLALSFLTTTVVVSFAQTGTEKTNKKQVKKGHKGGKKSKKGSGSTTPPPK